MIFRFLLLLLFSLFAGCRFISESLNESVLSSYAFEELTPDAQISGCSEIFKLTDSSQWKQIREESSVRLNGFSEEKWIKIRFKSSSAIRDWYLVLKWTTLDFSEFCSPLDDKNTDGQYSGIFIPYEKWDVHSFFPTFRFWQEPNTEAVYFLKLRSEAPLSVPLKILNFNDFLKEIRKVAAINFLFFGFALFIVSFNFFHYYESRSSIHLFNNIFSVSLAMTVLCRFGIAYEVLWRDFPEWQMKASNIFLGIAVYGGLEFTRRFLNVHIFYKRMDLAYAVLSSAGLLFSSAALLSVSRFYLSRIFAVFFAVIVLLVVVSAARVIVQKKYRPAKWFLMAVPFFLLMAFLNVIFHLDLWDYNRYWIYGLMMFMPVSFIFISLSVRDRMKELKKEAEQNRSEIQILLEKLEEYTKTKSKYSKTQISGLNVEKEIIKLIHLMENEKVYYDEDLNMEILAEKMNVSRHQLSEILNNVLGLNFHDFIKDYRIQETMNLIKSRQDLNILNIAFEVGFKSKSVFNAAFKRKTGLTPAEYRTMNP